MKKKYLMPLLLAAALILEILPYGAVLDFANPEGEPFRRTYSYFSLVPFSYASFGPLLTALMTSALLIIAVIYCFRSSQKLLKTIKIIAFLALIASIFPIVMGTRYISVVGVLISACILLLCITTFLKDK